MKKLCIIIACGILLSFINSNTSAQTIKQNIRGLVVDSDSKQPLIGVTLYIENSDPLIGTITNAEGRFVFENLPIGRYNIVANYLGYEPYVVPNILLGSGKEPFIKVELTESLTKLEEVVVTTNKNKGDALNDMATVSARSFTVEETKRYAGTFNDPARMVSSFAGVVGDPSGENNIIVRGNSPKGILWRLEGIEIPNPNHFANEGYSGGPINALNSAMLDNSDFFTGAFAPEYGNAYSGVFDMKLRTGNSTKREYSFSAGALGFDGTIEGPFRSGYNGSYLINYRYSSLAILDELGIVDFFGVPKYQDVSFKFFLPAGKAGTFTLFGLGGKSSIYQEAYDQEDEDYVTAKGTFSARLGTVGLTHTIALNPKTYIKTTLSGAGTGNDSYYEARNNLGEFYDDGRDDIINTAFRASTCINYKHNAQHLFKWGITYSDLAYNMLAEYYYASQGGLVREIDTKGNAQLLQGYLNWKYRIVEDLTLISGIHYIHFMYNDDYSIEPRLGLKYQANKNNSFTLGLGMHSKIESLATYNALVETEDGSYTTPNTNLGMSKAIHYVAGYQHHFSKYLRLKTEIYYQHLYDIPVENDPTSPIVYANRTGGWSNLDLINNGFGRNYGMEVTLERFYKNRFYYLLTGSIYDSKFTSNDGIERNSRFNGKYTGNLLLGKEFPIGDKSKNRSIGLNTKIAFFGGGYYTPLDLERSIEEGHSVYDYSRYQGVRADDIFKADFAITYRRDRNKTTHEFKIDVQNVTNHQAVVGMYYDDDIQGVEYSHQWSIFPNVIYTIQF